MGRRRHAGHVFAKVCAPNTKATWQTGSIPVGGWWKNVILRVSFWLVAWSYPSFLPSFLSPSLLCSRGMLCFVDILGNGKEEEGWSILRDVKKRSLHFFFLSPLSGFFPLSLFSPLRPSRIWDVNSFLNPLTESFLDLLPLVSLLPFTMEEFLISGLSKFGWSEGIGGSWKVIALAMEMNGCFVGEGIIVESWVLVIILRRVLRWRISFYLMGFLSRRWIWSNYSSKIIHLLEYLIWKLNFWKSWWKWWN